MIVLQHLQIKQAQENEQNEKNDYGRGYIYPAPYQTGFFGYIFECKIGEHVRYQYARQAGCILSGTLKTRGICGVCLAK